MNNLSSENKISRKTVNIKGTLDRLQKFENLWHLYHFY